MKQTLLKNHLVLAFLVLALSNANGQAISYIEDFSLTNLQSYTGTPLFPNEGIPEGITFSRDGLRMFVAGQSGDAVQQFSLTTPFNTNSGVTHDGSYSVAAQFGSNPRIYGVAFSNDGLKMFVTGTSSRQIAQYDLTTPYEVTSGVTFNTSLNIFTAGTPGSITFNDDGTKTYIPSGTGIAQLSLSVAFDITSTVAIEGTFTPSTWVPEEAIFTSDGMKMLVIEQSGDLIHQYDLTTAYEITSGVTDNGITFDVSDEDVAPSGLAISSDDASLFVLGLASGNQRVRQYDMAIASLSEAPANDGSIAGSATIKIARETFTNQGSTLTEGVDYDITNLPTGLSPSISVAAGGASAELSLSGSSDDNQAADGVAALDIIFSNSAFTGNDASDVYNANAEGRVIGISFNNNKVLSFGNAFNLANGATYELSYSVNSLQPLPRDVVFSADGLRMFTIGADTPEINQWTLSAPFNLGSSITFNGILNVSTEEPVPTGIAFSGDGLKLYIVGTEVNEYDLSTPYTVTSGVSHVGFSGAPAGTQGITFSTNGKKLYLISNWTTTDLVYQYSLPSPYDVAGRGIHDLVYNVKDQENAPGGVAFNATGTQMFVTGSSSRAVHQYGLTTPFDLAGGVTYDNVLYDVSSEISNPSGIVFSNDGTKLFISDFTGQRDINQYSIPSDGFIEATSNNGPVDGFLTVQVSGDNFQNPAGSLNHGVDYTISNLPTGLTPDLQVNGNGTIASLSFSGVATNNEDQDDVAELEISFSNSAFVSGDVSDILGINDPTGVGIDFRDNNPALLYGTGFDISKATYAYNSLDISGIDNQATSIRFNDDGTKLFFLGRQTNAVHQYSLSSPYVIDSDMTSDGTPYDVTGFLSDLYGLSFNEDGTKMYIVSNSTDDVHQFSLTTAFDITGTVNYDGSYVISEDGFPVSVTFNQDGSTMFVIGVSSDKIFQYSLSTPFDVTSTVSFEGDFSILNEEQAADRITFAAGGTKMLIIGTLGDEVNQYDLAVPYDITFGVTFDTNFSLSNEDFGPADFIFNPDGTVMYVLGIGNDKIFEYSLDKGGFSESIQNDGSVEGTININLIDETFVNPGGTLTNGVEFSVSPLTSGLNAELAVEADGRSASLTLTGQADNNQDIDDVADLIFTFNNSAFSGNNASSVSNSSSFSSEIGIDFRDNNPTVYYSDPLNLTNTSFSGTSVSVQTQDSYPSGISFNGDGTRIFVSGGNNSMVYEYSLSVPYDLSSTFAYTNNSLNVLTDAESPEDLFMSPDGTRLFILSTEYYSVVQYNLSTPFDLSTAAYGGNSFNIEPLDQSPSGLTFSPDGLKMYFLGTSESNIYQFSLTSAFDVSTASFDGSPFYFEDDISSAGGVVISQDGRRLILVGDDGDMGSYSLNVPFDITSGITFDGISFDISGEDRNGSGITSSPDGLSIFVVGYDVGLLSQYDVDATGFTETMANDGTIEGSASLFIVDDQFTNEGGTLSHTVDYTIDNLPAGLTPSLSIDAEGKSATLTLSGTPLSHGDLDDILGLEFTFTNSAFVTYPAGEVGNANNHNSGISIDFIPYTENDITAFTFDKISGDAMLDNTGHTVNAVAEAGTDISAITPDITTSQNSSITPNTGEEQDFTNAVTYTVTADDGTPQDWEITITEAISAPTDISLTAISVDENSTLGTVVGALSAVDANFEETFTFSVVDDLGSDDWQSFDISGDNLVTTDFISLDFESKNSFTFTLSVEDADGETFEKEFTVTLNDLNESPTDIALDNTSVDESNPAGTLVGNLSTTDEDAGDSFIYSLKDGVPDNNAFEIQGDELVTSVELDFETKTSYDLEIISTDQGGLTFEKSLTVSVNDLPAQITSIELDNLTIDENGSTGNLVGVLSTSGEDLSGSFTYSLVVAQGGNDNDSFTISGNQLLSASTFDFESKNSYNILVLSDDGNRTGTSEFTILVNDVNEAPTDIMLSISQIAENNAVDDLIGILTATDEDILNNFSYNLVAGLGDTDNDSFTVFENELRAATIFDFETKSSYSLRVEANDGNGGTFEEAFNVLITDENESILVASPIADQDLDERFSSIAIDLNTVFEDQDGDPLTFDVSSSNTDVVTADETNGTLTVTEVGAFGSSTVTVTADDGSGITTSDEFVVTVKNVNDDPVVDNETDDQNVDEGFAVLELNLTGVFSDEDGDALMIGASSSEEAVATVITANELLTITEVNNGTSIITVTADDGNGGLASYSFTITINNVNDAPIVSNPLADQSVDEGFGSIEVDFGNVFSDEDGDQLTISTNSSDEAIATVTIVNDQLSITEVSNGTSIITVVADDGNGGSVTESFTLTINNVNDAPIVSSPLEDRSVDEGFGSIEVDFGNVFDDEDGDELTYSVTSSETGVATVSQSGTVLTISEVGLGTSTITITAEDGSGATVDEDFIVTVNNVNEDPIVANEVIDQQLEEGFGTSLVSYVDVFTDADGDALTVSATSSDETVLTVALASDSQIELTEVGIGAATITLIADDGNGGSVTSDFVVTISELEIPLGLEDDLKVKIFPNPVVNFLSIESDQAMSVDLVDLNGRAISQASGFHLKMDMRKVPNGIYVLTIKSGNQITRERIIKQH